IRSISFFDIEKHATANSRWSRACTRALGLVKDGKAQHLALQHPLEAFPFNSTFWIEPNLILDYALCCNILTLDIGMDTTCILTTSCSTVRVETRTSTGKLKRVLWKTENCSTRTVEKCFKLLLWTIMIPNGSWCSDVIRWEEGYFQHSRFLAGEATVSAWGFVVENGVLRAVWP
ncbi:hypothetical protein HID58_006844, partial [Brassica napus]